MDHSLLFAKIEELYPEYVRVLADVCEIESPTSYKEGVDAVGRYFVALAEKRGWNIEIEHDEAAGDPICITLNPDASDEPFCLSGHIDTVHPLGLFKKPRVRIEENCIYGPGVLDCKGGVVASFLAMDALWRCGFNKRPRKLLRSAPLPWHSWV